MRSMTGFGRGESAFENGRIVLEIRTVNHRFLEIRNRAPGELAAAEPLIEKLLRSHLNRGHCTVGLVYEGPGGALQVNRSALKNHLENLLSVADDMKINLADLVPVLAAVPDLFSISPNYDQEELEKVVTIAFKGAMEKLLLMRENEGAAMSAEISERLRSLSASVTDLAAMAKEYPAQILEKTRKRIGDLIAGTNLKLDPGRVEAEAALLADRTDINEELTRLASHCDQMASLIESEDPIGRRMEFLVQEMAREANTMGAKAGFVEFTYKVVDFKADLEKIRELAQNVE